MNAVGTTNQVQRPTQRLEIHHPRRPSPQRVGLPFSVTISNARPSRFARLWLIATKLKTPIREILEAVEL